MLRVFLNPLLRCFGAGEYYALGGLLLPVFLYITDLFDETGLEPVFGIEKLHPQVITGTVGFTPGNFAF
jgi:hypothetical protein